MTVLLSALLGYEAITAPKVRRSAGTQLTLNSRSFRAQLTLD
jgi:hypothetical protein